MEMIPPDGLSAAQLNRALQAFAGVVGKDHVLASDADRDSYIDPYAPGDGRDHAASAAVQPGSTEEVQALVRLANEYKVPLWPVSKGKNLGYGGPAPVLPGSVVVDLARQERHLAESDARAQMSAWRTIL